MWQWTGDGTIWEDGLAPEGYNRHHKKIRNQLPLSSYKIDWVMRVWKSNFSKKTFSENDKKQNRKLNSFILLILVNTASACLILNIYDGTQELKPV